MQDLIAAGETWFQSQRREHLATEVSYQPAIGATRTVRATVVIGRWESIDSAGQMLRTETQDFFVDTTDLAQDPKRGDRIVAGSFTYQVMIPPGAEHHWRWADRNKTLRRIHTMVTEGPSTRSPFAVPGAPTITVFSSSQVLFWEEPADGGAGELTGYKLFRNGVLVETGESWVSDSANVYDAGAVMRLLAINSFGEGPLSAPVTVT